MVSTQVVIGLTRTTPLEPEKLEELAEVCLDALNEKARFLAFGPVISVNFAESTIEVECTVCTETPDQAEVDAKMESIGDIMRSAIAAAEYKVSAERTPVTA
jgi:hypothetical protein